MARCGGCFHVLVCGHPWSRRLPLSARGPTRFPAILPILPILPILFALPSCDPERRDVPITWSFADGRDCTGAGVAEVQITSRADPAGTLAQSFPCRAGTLGDQATATAIPVGAGVGAAALSGAGGVLYQGLVPFDDSSRLPLNIVLYFTGAWPR